MKKTVILSLLLLSFLTGRAQQPSPFRLSLDDFAIQDTTALEPSYLHILWKSTDKERRVGQTRCRYTEYDTGFSKVFSWIRVDQDMDEQLAVNQTLYEIAQSIARAMTDSLLFQSLNTTQVNKRLNHNYSVARKAYLETGEPSFPASFGQDFDIASVGWEPTRKGRILSFSLEETLLLGVTPGLSSPITSLSASFGFFRHHMAILADASYGFGRYSGRYSNLAGLFRDGEIVPYWTFSFQSAYRIPCLHRGMIAPFAGVGYSSLGLVDNIVTDRKSRLQGLALSEGIIFDLFSRSQTVDFRGPRHDLIQNGLRLKLYTSQILTLPQHSLVPTLNLGIGYVFSSQGVKPRP